LEEITQSYKELIIKNPLFKEYMKVLEISVLIRN
jgi:Mevalonate 5-diphosphate decarboxylase C-terminal domain